MGAIRTLADSAYADGPANAPQQPPKNDIRELFGLVDDAVAPVPGLVSDVADLREDVDALVTGVKWKDPVRTVALVNTSVSSGLENGDVVNGVTLATGDRVLLVNQSSAETNGVYVVVASGAASRATDVDTGAEILAAGFFVEEGTDDAGTSYFLNTAGPITLGSTALTFVKVAGLGYGVASDPTAIEGAAIDELMTPSNTKAVLDNRLSGVTGSIKEDGVLYDFVGGVRALRDASALTGALSNLPGSGATFARSSTKMVTGPDGLQKIYAAGALSYEFDQQTRKALGLRLEDAVTNMWLRTHIGTGWSIGGVTNNAASVPGAREGGGNTANEIILSGSSSHHARQLNIAVTDGVTYVNEELIKRVAGDGSIWMVNTLDANSGVRFFWNADGTLTATPSHTDNLVDYGWEYAGNDFYRIWIALEAGAGALISMNTYFANELGQNVHSDTGTWHHDGAWFYEGRGLRNAPDTTGSTATSVRDSFTLDVSGDELPRLGAAGTIVLDIGAWVERAAANHVFLDLINSGGNERIYVRNDTLGLGEVAVEVENTAGSTDTMNLGSGLQGGFTLAITWSPEGVTIYKSGVEADSSTVQLNMAAADTCYIGPNGASATTNAVFKRFEYWPSALTAAEVSGSAGVSGLSVVGGHQVILDGSGATISPAASDVYASFAQTADRIAYASDMYNGQVLPYRQKVPGTTPVLKSARNRLLMSAAAGQSLSVSSTTYDSGGTVLFADPQHAPVVLMFPYGPQGFNNVLATAGDVDEIVAAESVYRDSGSATVGDTHNLACAYAYADMVRGQPYRMEPRVVTGWGVGDQTVADLMEGGASNSWANFETILAGFVTISVELDMEPVVDWLIPNQGEANQNTAQASYVSQWTSLLDAYKTNIEPATGQATGELRIIFQQLGSRKTSSLPSGICEVPLAQEQLSEEYSDCYLVPTYWVQHNYAADQSHLDYEGFILVGEITARAQAWVDEWKNRDRLPTLIEGDWVGCKLLSWERVGTAVTLTFNVPLKHLGYRLAIDTSSLPAFPKYGIEFLDDGTPISITGDPALHPDGDKITLTLGSSPSGTEKVRIGYTNTTADGLGFVRPGTNIRTTWSKPSLFIPGVALFDWCQMGEKTAV